MKKDVNELKKMFFDILQNPSMAQHHVPVFADDNMHKELSTHSGTIQSTQPVILHQGNGDIHHHEDVEESLSIMDKEKELILKALKKHKGKRKDAAIDLGISERTLYRKLKEYDIDE